MAWKAFQAVLLALLAGALTVVQTGFNTMLASKGLEGGVPGLVAAFVNFCVGLIVIVGVAFAHTPNLKGIHVCQAPMEGLGAKLSYYKYFLGGPCGCTFIVASIYITKVLGFALTYVIQIAGTLTFSLVMDRWGLLGMQKRTLTVRQLGGLALLIGGVIMVQDPGGGDDSSSSGSGDEHSTGLRVLVSILSFFSGFANPTQAALNKTVCKEVGTPFRACALSFAGGVIALGFACTVAMLATWEVTYVVTEPAPKWYYYVGGVMGAYFVTAGIVAVPQLGAATYYCLMVSSQLTVAFLFDSLGLLDYEAKKVTPLRVIGTVTSCVAVAIHTWPSRATDRTAEGEDEEDPDSAEQSLELEQAVSLEMESPPKALPAGV